MNPTDINAMPITPVSSLNFMISAIIINMIEMPVNFCINLFENIFLYSPLSNFLTNIESMKSNIIEITTIKIVFIILFILYFYH